MVKTVSDKLAQSMYKPKTKKGKRALEARAPKVNENPKNLIVLRGRTNPIINELLQDIAAIRRPMVVALSRRQENMHPFENMEPIEYLCKKNDTSLFAYGSSSKKRPARLVLGRTFGGELLDMQEYKVSDYKSSASFSKGLSWEWGSKPMMVFQGAAFDHDDEMKQTKSLLLDAFKGPQADSVSLMGLKRVIVCTALEQTGAATSRCVLFRQYVTSFKRTGTKLPHVETTEVGPSFKLEVDRRKAPIPDIWKAALRQPKELRTKKQKNVTTNALGQTIGRIHLGRQEIDKMHTPHFHGDGKKKAKKAAEAAE